jgi:hypothetical protein
MGPPSRELELRELAYRVAATTVKRNTSMRASDSVGQAGAKERFPDTVSHRSNTTINLE